MSVSTEELHNYITELQRLAQKATSLNESGAYDRASRWYPESEAAREYCRRFRRPSRQHPFSYLKACCTIKANVQFGHITAAEATLVRVYSRVLKSTDPLVRAVREQRLAARLTKLRQAGR